MHPLVFITEFLENQSSWIMGLEVSEKSPNPEFTIEGEEWLTFTLQQREVLPSCTTYSVAEEEAGFPDTAVSNQEKLEKVVAKVYC
jgi:hypothetical protein